MSEEEKRKTFIKEARKKLEKTMNGIQSIRKIEKIAAIAYDLLNCLGSIKECYLVLREMENEIDNKPTLYEPQLDIFTDKKEVKRIIKKIIDYKLKQM